MKHIRLRHLVIALAAGAAGYAVNMMPYADVSRLWLGRIVTLPIAILFGPWYGTLSAVVAGAAPFDFGRGATAFTPFMLAVFALEAAILGVCARRRKSPILAGTLVWIVVGLIVLLFPSLYGFIYPRRILALLTVQRVLNGMVAVVLADFISMLIPARIAVVDFQSSRRQLRHYSFHAFVLVAVLPVLLLSTGAGQAVGARQEAEGGARLHEVATALGNHIDEYLTTHAHAVEALAATLGAVPDNADTRKLLLMQYADTYKGFRSLRITAPDGTVHTFVPPTADGTNRRSIADRRFFVEAMRTGKVTISNVIVGTSTQEPRLAVAAPLNAHGPARGVVYGTLDLSKFQQFVERYQRLPEATVVILDHYHRVIYASDPSWHTVQQDLSDDELVRQSSRAVDGIFQYTPKTPGGRRGAQLVGESAIDVAGWKVFVGQPRINLFVQTPAYYGLTLALIALALGGAVLGARSFANAVTHPLEQLETIVRNVSAEQTQPKAGIGPDAPAEIAALVEDINGMQSRLADSHRQREQALAERDRLNTHLQELTTDLDRKVRGGRPSSRKPSGWPRMPAGPRAISWPT